MAADEVEHDRMEGDFTRARLLKIWCFCSKPRGVCIKTRKLVQLPDEDALNPVLALAYSFVALPLSILDAINPRISVQPVKEDLTILTLESNELKKIPGSIIKLEGLEELDLSDNLFKRFPASVASLPALRVLRVTSNAVRNVSPKVGSMSMLRELRLDKNRIEKLPAELARLKGLLILSLSDNAISEFPEVICDCSGLQELWLEKNMLSTLPNRIDELKSLETLALGINAFRTMPYALSQLRELKDLRLGRNQLSTLMTTAAIKANKTDSGMEKELKVEPFKMMVSLESLHLGVNHLAMLPADLWKIPRLVEINLRGNSLQTISEEIERTKNTLEALFLDDNQLQQLPNCLQHCRQLSKLTVCGNLLEDLPELPPSLTQLLLRNNRLKSLPKCLLSNTALEELDVRDNNELADAPPYLLRDEEAAEYLKKMFGNSVGGKRGVKGGKSRKGASSRSRDAEGAQKKLAPGSHGKAKASKRGGAEDALYDEERNSDSSRATRTATWVKSQAGEEAAETGGTEGTAQEQHNDASPVGTGGGALDVKQMMGRAKRYTGRRGDPSSRASAIGGQTNQVGHDQPSRSAAEVKNYVARGRLKKAINTVRASNAASSQPGKRDRRAKKMQP